MTSMDEALSDRKDSATIDRKDTLTGTGAWSNAASSVFKRHSTPSPPQYKTYTLRRAGRLSSNYVVQHGTTTQLIVVSSWTGKPDIVLHIGDNKSSPVMAAAKFKTFSSNFRICLGDPNDSINTEWEDVVCEDTLKHAVYAFSLRTPAVSSLDAGPSMRKKFMWKRTHDSSLGAKKLSNRNFKLVDLAGNVLAVFLHARSLGGEKGTLEWKVEPSPEEEVGCLLVFAGIFEKIRRRESYTSD